MKKRASDVEASSPSRRSVVVGAATLLCGGNAWCSGDDRVDASSSPATQPDAPRLGTLKVNKVLFVGNSITLHPPAPAIGWTGNWGMAASSIDKDYAHLLLSHFKQRTGAEPASMIRNIADFERGYATYDIPGGIKEMIAFEADLVVVAIGENVPALQSDADRTAFEKAVAELLKAFRAGRNPAICVRSCFWPDAAKDAILKKTCTDAGGTFVDISGLEKDEANFARSERQIAHAGVGAHPGDKGMAAIANAIWQAIAKKAEMVEER